MSHHRCCCVAGTYTLLTPCECSDIANGPHYADNYDPALGCVYLRDPVGGNCWYAGPESPSKDVLDPGDILLSGYTLTQVETPDIACCLCCECGETNPTPLACFDTPVGGCECCPGVNDGAEWMWTWSTQHLTRLEGRNRAQVNAYGSIHYKNLGATVCDRVLSVDLLYETRRWNSSGVLICDLSVPVTDCADLWDVYASGGVYSIAPCGERLLVRDWPIPRPSSISGDPCSDSDMVNNVGNGPPWTSVAWDGTTGCTWTGKSYSSGGFDYTVVGTITFSGDCHRSRVEWSFTQTKRDGGGAIRATFTASGFVQYEMVKPPCPGGCGDRARFFGVGAIPPAPTSPAPPAPLMAVPRSLGGMLA